MRNLNLKKRIILNALGVSRRQNKWGPDRMNSRRRADREISESEYSSYVMQMELLGEVKSKVGGTSALVSGNPSSEQDGLVVVDEDIDENEKYYYYNNIRELESEWGTVNWDSGATPY